MWSCLHHFPSKETGELFNSLELNFPQSSWFLRPHLALKLYDIIVMYFWTWNGVHMYPLGFLVSDNRLSERSKETNDAIEPGLMPESGMTLFYKISRCCTFLPLNFCYARAWEDLLFQLPEDLLSMILAINLYYSFALPSKSASGYVSSIAGLVEIWLHVKPKLQGNLGNV